MCEAEWKLSVRIAGNTRNPCIQAIAAKGYNLNLWYSGDDPDDWESPQWDADKDGRRFSATSPEELLGLIAMWEVRGDDWRLKSGEGALHDQLLEKAVIYDAEGNALPRSK